MEHLENKNVESEEEVGPVEAGDQVIDAIGDFGPWQLRNVLLICIVTLFPVFPVLSITFMNAKTDFWCAPPANLSAQPGFDLTKWRRDDGPTTLKDGIYVRNECLRWKNPLHKDESIPCRSWNYDATTYRTVIHQFNLVCDREWLVDLTQTVYFGGLLVGVFVAGWLSDRFGRKFCVVPLTLGMATVGTLSAFSPSVEWYFAARFFHGAFTIGVYTLNFVWIMEMVGGRWFSILGVGFQLPWITSWFLLALVAYVAPYWGHIQLITSVPAFFSVIILYFVPESIKYLLAVNRLKEAEVLIIAAAKRNGRALPEDFKLIPLQHGRHFVHVVDGEAGVKKSIYQRVPVLLLFSRSDMAKKTLILFFNWFTNSLVYYGLTLNSYDLGGTVMADWLLYGAMELPAYVISLLVLLYIGRKLPYVAMMWTGGAALLFTLAVPRGVYAYNWPQVALATVGKLFITGTFVIVYVYSVEIYPTVVRSVGLGSSSVFARLAGMVAPHLSRVLSESLSPSLPVAIFGATALVAGLLTLFLPETFGKRLPDTLQDADQMPIDIKDGIVNYFKRKK